MLDDTFKSWSVKKNMKSSNRNDDEEVRIISLSSCTDAY
jgi:hypothetical protein